VGAKPGRSGKFEAMEFATYNINLLSLDYSYMIKNNFPVIIEF